MVLNAGWTRHESQFGNPEKKLLSQVQQMEDLWTTSEELFTYVDEDGMEHSEVVRPMPDPSLTSGGMSSSSFGVLETYTGTMPRPSKNGEALKAMAFDHDRFGVINKSDTQYKRLVDRSRG